MKKVIITTLFAFFLLSCGGGSDNNSDAESTRTNNDVIDSSVTKISFGDSKYAVSKVVSGDESFDGNFQEVVETSRPAGEQLVLAIGDNDQLIWLGIANPSTASLKLDASSTAHALVKLFPYLASIYKTKPNVVNQVLQDDENVKKLSSRIDAIDNWSDMSDDLVLSYYSETIVSVVNKVNEILGTNKITAKKLITPDPSVDPGRKSGVEMLVNGETSQTDNPRFSVEAKNHFARWVKVALWSGDLTDDKVGEPIDVFDVSGDNFFAIGSSNVKRYYSTSELDEELYVAVVGPGLESFSFSDDKLGDYLFELYLEASLNTLVIEMAMPTIGVITGAPDSCLKSIYSPLSANTNFFKELLGSSEFELLLHEENYYQAGLEATKVGMESILKTSQDCLATSVAKKIAVYLTPILGEFAILMKTAELSARLAPVAYSWASSSQYENWWYLNTTDLELDIKGAGESWIFQDSSDYTFADDLTPALSSLYAGDCNSNDPSTSCFSKSFKGSGPYSIVFKVKCSFDDFVHDCSKVHITPTGNVFETKTIDAEGGEVEFIYDYPEPGEYKGYIEVVDLDGAIKGLNFHLQIKSAGIWDSSRWNESTFAQ